MALRLLRVTLNGTGFAADYAAACYGLIPHKNGVAIRLAGVTSGHLHRAGRSPGRGPAQGYATQDDGSVHPGIDNICCAQPCSRPLRP